MKLYETIHSEEFLNFWDSVSVVSSNSNDIPLCSSDEKIFFYERFCKEKGFKEHNVDSVTVCMKAENCIVNFIEFKGGKTPDDWDKDCFALKGFDTLHCGLPKLLGDDFDDWVGIFSKKLIYYIVCSDDNIIFKSDLVSKQKFRRRPQILEGRHHLDKMSGSLQRYANKHPFDKIVVTCSTIFLSDMLNKVL